MGKTSYKNTTQLIKDLSDRIEDLNNGNLSIDELDDLVESGKSLYEHLVILRHLAFEKHEKSEQIEDVRPEEEAINELENPSEESIPELSFDLTGEAEPKQEEEENLHFDFTQVSEEPENEKVEESMNELTEEETPAPISFEQDKPNDKGTTNFTSEDESNSLNDAFKKEDELSLRKKLQNTAISDIKTHISIAKKFEYISSLFNGDSDAYDEAIDFLNSCATGEDARLKLNEYTTQYSWDLEDKSIIKFIELVERRYINA